MLSNVTFPFSGSTPKIYPFLLPKNVTAKNTQKTPTSPRKDFIKVCLWLCGFYTQKVLHSKTLPNGQTLQVLQADIANLAVDAVVHPTNDSFYMGGMVGTCLMKVGGAAFAEVMDNARKDIRTLQKLDGMSLRSRFFFVCVHPNNPWHHIHFVFFKAESLVTFTNNFYLWSNWLAKTRISFTRRI